MSFGSTSTIQLTRLRAGPSSNNLHRRAVMRHAFADDGIDQPPPRLVAIDQQLTRHIAVGKSDDAGTVVEFGVDDKARR